MTASSLLSFVFLGIYWSNHLPFTTSWMSESGSASIPAAAYGGVLIFAAVAYPILQATIIRAHGPASRLAVAIGRDRKGRLSLFLYVAAIPLAFIHGGIAKAIFAIAALIGLVPDRRIETTLSQSLAE